VPRRSSIVRTPVRVGGSASVIHLGLR
jgi:hypothetical protein